jgi:sugar O-acyltransferase (sialic acid O-acetyltransferase NeuD family)
MSECLIYGTGGHAKVIADIARLNNITVTAFFADNTTTFFKELPVHTYDPSFSKNSPVIIAIGNNEIRKRIASLLSHKALTLIHPTAVIASDAHIGEGTAILAGAIVQADATIGDHCIINISSGIEHDAVVGDYVHIGPHCYIGGGAVIGHGALIGAGSVIMRNTNIPAWTNVPPGSIITQ